MMVRKLLLCVVGVVCAAELARYRHVVSCVDWPGATNVAADCADKVFTKKDFVKKREDLRRLANSLVSQVEKGRK